MSIKVAGRHFVDEAGQPWFWLADTAWNAALRDDEPAWAKYLDARAAQGFTVIQFVATQWRGCSQPIHGPIYETKGDRITFNDAALGKLDRWVRMIDERGMVAAPVMLWANTPTCPGQALTEKQCIALGRHMLERWGGLPVAWMLAGDGDYRDTETAERWKRIGRAVFAEQADVVATMHPAGLQWIVDHFADEPWYTFAGIQSGHGADDDSLRFLQSEDYATRWKQLAMPFVNLEPNYELAYAYGTRDRHGAFEVRRAAYWSLLVAPPAGVTYGSSPIWIWSQSEGEHAEGHSPDWTADPWHTALTTPGIESMATMRTIMDRLRWTQLRPAPQRLADQPGEADPNRFIAAAESKDGAQLVLYIPAGDRVVVMFENAIEAKRIDPRTGSVDEQPLQSSDGRVTVDPPNERDWLFVLKR